VRTFDNLSIQQRFRTAGTSSNAHTYRLLIVKDRILTCLAVFCESFCSSAAEKRDYAVFRLTRQPLVFLQHQRSYQNIQLNYLISFSFSRAAEAGREL
jgi:hypothetical protein